MNAIWVVVDEDGRPETSVGGVVYAFETRNEAEVAMRRFGSKVKARLVRFVAAGGR